MVRVRWNKDGTVSEASIQKALIEYITLKGIRKYVLSIPNESASNPIYGKKLKDLGLRKGASDLFFAMPRRGFHGFFLELKSENGVLRPDQREFFKDMEAMGYFTSMCRSLNSAIEITDWYCFGKEI